jgi:hypothetical protein
VSPTFNSSMVFPIIMFPPVLYDGIVYEMTSKQADLRQKPLQVFRVIVK